MPPTRAPNRLAATVSATTRHAVAAIRGSTVRLSRARERRTVLPRMAATACLVVALTVAANRFGALVGGMLAALPVLAYVLAVFTHRQLGSAAAIELLRGTLAGMVGFVAFCELVAVLLTSLGLWPTFVAA